VATVAHGTVLRGEIWAVALGDDIKPRPALVLSIDAINDLCPDVILVPITSKAGPLRVEIGAASEGTGLEHASFAKCTSVGPVHKARLKRRIGRVPATTLRAIEVCVARVLGLPG
jgi:mRNA interferase MazF